MRTDLTQTEGLIDLAIHRIRSLEEEALSLSPEGYWGCFSGGKDSVVIRELARLAEVKIEWHYAITCVDPVDLVQFVKRECPDVSIDIPPRTMWELIQTNGPPYRNRRWCCKELKERGGIGRLCITGVRWQESSRRAGRKMVEACYRSGMKGKKFLHPIIDWTGKDVWTFIRERRLPYCKLYDPPYNYRRLGCVLCPMVAGAQLEKQIRDNPKLVQQWRKSIHKFHSKWLARHPNTRLQTPEDFFQFWLSRKGPPKQKGPSSKYVLFEDDPNLDSSSDIENQL